MNESKQTAIDNLARLETIKAMVDQGVYTSLGPIREKVRGSATLYTILASNNIVSKNNKGILEWVDTIPVTKTLANTLTNELRMMNRAYAKTHTPVVKILEPKPAFQLDEKVYNAPVERKVRKPRRKIEVSTEAIVNDRVSRPIIEFVLLWGVIKLNIG